MATYVFAVSFAILFSYLGVLKIGLWQIVPIFVTGFGSAALLYAAAGRARTPFAIDCVSLVTDIFIITWAVHESGGIDSPWFIWYLAVAGEAAFLLATYRAVFWVSLGNILAYLAVLDAAGQIRSFDAPLFTALARILFLHAAAAFFLRGVLDLKEKQVVIKRLKENESRKVEELTRLTAALDQRTRDLANANGRIRESDRLKSQFLANMSHELRTPLNSIIGFSEILLTRLGEQLPPKYQKFLQNINGSGHHLLGIINDILDLSKIEAGKMDVSPEPFSVAAIADGVVQVIRGVAQKREIAIEVDIPHDLPDLDADPVRFKQILYNLLSNAVKFSPDASTVTLRARLLPAALSPLREDAIQVSVVDRGIGIDAKDHNVIFQEFRQADGSSTRKYEGTGLGLSLVKAFLELQRGTISVESEPGLGSTFRATLPLRFMGPALRADTTVERLAPRLDTEKHRVLVIEDDPDAYDVIARALTSAFYIPLRARNGEEAIMLAHTLKPSAITLDLVLPGLDGWEVLKALKNDTETVGIPVIIVSVMENRELGVALGADDYFLKPVDYGQLVGRLKELIPAAGRKGANILVIDDDPLIHDLFDGLLSPLGYRVDHAHSGPEGLTMAARQPALVVLDLMMDGMDGFEVASRLQSNGATARVPVVVLTARDLTPEDRLRLAGKITTLLQKGKMPHHQLVNVIDDLVKRQKAEVARA